MPTDIANVPGRVVPDREKYRDVGLIASGLQNSPYEYHFDDFIHSAALEWNVTNVGTGTAVAAGVSARSGGHWQVSTGATANSFRYEQSAGYVVATAGTTKWYSAWKLKLNQTMDNVAKMGCGMHDSGGTKSIHIGYNGPLDATNFGITFDGNRTGTQLSLATAIDTNYHLFELYCRGDNVIRGRLDSGAEVSATMTLAATGPCYIDRYVGNGATATDRTYTIDWSLFIYPRS